MKLHQLVAAMVLRVGQTNSKGVQSLRPFTWSELAIVFDVTKDKARHQLNRFREKYNVIEEDVVLGWNRSFLSTHAPEDERDDLADLAQLPGDVLNVDNEQIYVVVDTSTNAYTLIDDELYQDGCFDDKYNTSAAKTKKRVRPSKLKTRAKKVDEKGDAVEIAELYYMVTPVSLIVVRDGQPLTIDRTHKNFEKIHAALKDKKWQAALDNIDMKTAISTYSNGRVTVSEGNVLFDGNPVHPKLTERLINCLIEENLEALEALAKFIEKCDENPDFQVVSRIYDFISHNDLRLDKEGNILAYKIVRSTYFDKHSNTMDNKPGKLVKMKRNLVNSKDHETCSTGLHVAAKGYLGSFGSVSSGDKVVLCQVHPKDFVSIPTDYNSMKARTCEYLVLKDVTSNFKLDEGIEA